MVTKEPNAQVQVCVHIIPQLVFHEANNIKCYFVFNKTKNLDINNFGQLNVFRKLMVEDGRRRKLLRQNIISGFRSFSFHKNTSKL
jgi:hypothetical protein